jgi:hypothetical protein
MVEPLVNTTARSITFSSSRTLPGQSYLIKVLDGLLLNGRDLFVIFPDILLQEMRC